jgi:hypothetical protein
LISSATDDQLGSRVGHEAEGKLEVLVVVLMCDLLSWSWYDQCKLLSLLRSLLILGFI